MSSSLVYIASPYSIGEPFTNIRRSVEAWKRLYSAGISAFSPLAQTSAIQMLHPLSEAEWYAYDLELLERCDVLLRLPGESKGADIEESHARELGMPVYTSVEDCIEALRGECDG